MSNYLFYDYATSTVGKVKEGAIEYDSYPTIQQYLNQKCMENGSSYAGRKQSFQYLTKQKKFVPILISYHPLEIYFPIESVKSPKCIWINYNEIIYIEYKEKECIIYFKDQTLYICKYPQRIKNTMIHIKRFLILSND